MPEIAAAFGVTDGYWPPTRDWKIFLKASEFNDPPPARLFVLVDMREDSIVWGNFYTSMSGAPNSPVQHEFFDLPGMAHDGAAGFSFAAGHTELHRWQDRRTVPPLLPPVPRTRFSSPNNADIVWLQQHTTGAK